jgi:glycosyltransferase involved in cell wall biosynthesis
MTRSVPCTTSQPTILQVVGMNPNKRGIVELQMIEMSYQLSARGSRLVCCYNHDAPAWLRDWMFAAGGELASLPDPGGASAADVVRLALELKADMVHLHFVPLSPLVTLLRRAGIRHVVVTEHSWRPMTRRYLARAIVWHLQSRHINRFVAVSHDMARQVKRDFLVSGRRVRTILNGVRLDYFKPRSDKAELRKRWFNLDSSAVIIAAAAWLDPRKRLDMLVRAMPEITFNIPQAHLVIAGGGQEEEPLRRLIAELRLASHVQLLTGDNRVEEIYAASDIGALPSKAEGIGGAAIEAMACGLPLVATPCPGLAEVPEHGVSGLLVRDQTPHGFAVAVTPLLKDSALRQEMGRAARLRAEQKFDVRRTASETIALYAEVLGARL